MNSKEILLKLTELFTYYLEELCTVERNDFIHGEMTAYVECLEIIAECSNIPIPKDIATKYDI